MFLRWTLSKSTQRGRGFPSGTRETRSSLWIPDRAAKACLARGFLHLFEILLLLGELALQALHFLLLLGLNLVVLDSVAIGIGFDKVNGILQLVDVTLQIRDCGLLLGDRCFPLHTVLHHGVRGGCR